MSEDLDPYERLRPRRIPDSAEQDAQRIAPENRFITPDEANADTEQTGLAVETAPNILQRSISRLKGGVEQLRPPEPEVLERPDVARRMKDIDTLQAEADIGGKMGIMDTIKDHLTLKHIPVLGSIVKASLNVEAIQAQKRLKADKYKNPMDKIRDNNLLVDKANKEIVEQLRERTLGAELVGMALDSAEFASTFLLTRGRAEGVQAALGKKALQASGKYTAKQLAAEVAKRSASGLSKEAVSKLEKRIILKELRKNVGTSAMILPASEAARLGTFTMMNEVMSKLSDRMAPVLSVDPDTNQVTFEKPQRDMMKEFLRQEGLQYIEQLSEGLGEGLSYIGGRLIGKTASKFLSGKSDEALLEAFTTRVSKDLAETAATSGVAGKSFKDYMAAGGDLIRSPRMRDVVQRYRNVMNTLSTHANWQGIVPELGEEYIGEVARSVLNLNSDMTDKDGKLIPYETRVMESLLGPVANPTDYLKMAAAFSIVPSIGAAGALLSGTPSVERTRANIEALRLVTRDKDAIKSIAEIDHATDALAAMAHDDVTYRWFADNQIGEKLNIRNAKRGSLSERSTVMLGGHDVKEVYDAAVKEATASGATLTPAELHAKGRGAIRDLVMAQRFTLNVSNEDAKVLRSVVSQGFGAPVVESRTAPVTGFDITDIDKFKEVKAKLSDEGQDVLRFRDVTSEGRLPVGITGDVPISAEIAAADIPTRVAEPDFDKVFSSKVSELSRSQIKALLINNATVAGARAIRFFDETAVQQSGGKKGVDREAQLMDVRGIAPLDVKELFFSRTARSGDFAEDIVEGRIHDNKSISGVDVVDFQSRTMLPAFMNAVGVNPDVMAEAGLISAASHDTPGEETARGTLSKEVVNMLENPRNAIELVSKLARRHLNYPLEGAVDATTETAYKLYDALILVHPSFKADFEVELARMMGVADVTPFVAVTPAEESAKAEAPKKALTSLFPPGRGVSAATAPPPISATAVAAILAPKHIKTETPIEKATRESAELAAKAAAAAPQAAAPQAAAPQAAAPQAAAPQAAAPQAADPTKAETPFEKATRESAEMAAAASAAEAPTAEAPKSRVTRLDIISRKRVQDNPGTTFLFGDNLEEKGMGGQAFSLRGEPNSVGIPTKRKPTRNADAYFSDATYDENIVAIDKGFAKIPAGGPVVIPSAGLGTGLADLQSKAPRTFEYLQNKIAELEKPAEAPKAEAPAPAVVPKVEEVREEEKPVEGFYADGPPVDNRASFNAVARSEMRFSELLDILGNSEQNLKRFKAHMKKATEFRKALRTDEAYLAWINEPTQRNDADKTIRDLLFRAGVDRQVALSFRNRLKRAVAPKVFKALMKMGEVFKIVTESADNAAQLAQTVRTSILNRTSAENINNTLIEWRTFAVAKGADSAPAAPFLTWLIGVDELMGKSLEVLEGFNSDFVAPEMVSKKGKRMSPTAYREARASYQRFARTAEGSPQRATAELLKSRKFTGAKWMDEVMRATHYEFKQYDRRLVKTEADLVALREGIGNKLWATEHSMGDAGTLPGLDLSTKNPSNLIQLLNLLSSFPGEEQRPFSVINFNNNRRGNLLDDSHALRVFSREEDLSDFGRLFGGRDLEAGDDVRTDRADVNDITTTSLDKILRHAHTSGVSDFYMWAGQFAEKDDVYIVNRPKYSTDRKSKATLEALQQYRADYDRLVQSDTAGRYVDKWAKKNVERTRADYAQQFLHLPDMLEITDDDYSFDYALNAVRVIEALHGPITDYDTAFELTKRGGSTLTGGTTVDADIIGRKHMNTIIINDPQLYTETQMALVAAGLSPGDAKEITDGAGILLPESASLIQGSIGGLESREAEFGSLDTAKMLLSGSDKLRRALVKFNFITLTPELASQEGSVYEIIQRKINQFKADHPKVNLDAIVFSSAAKKGSLGKVIDIFDHDTVGNNFTEKIDVKLKDTDIVSFPWSDLVWVLDARHSTIPEMSKRPIQLRNTLDTMTSHMEIQQASEQHRLETALAEVQASKGFKATELVDLEKDPQLQALVTADGPLREVSSPRYENRLLQAAVVLFRKKMEYKSPMVQSIEIPLGASSNYLKALTAGKTNADGEFVPLTHKELHSRAGHTVSRLSGVNTNITDKGRRFTMDSAKYSTINAATDYMTNNYALYTDMAVWDDNFVARDGKGGFEIRWKNYKNWKWQTWELVKGADNMFKIPGEVVSFHRVPADNVHSTTVARLNNRVNGGRGNFIQTALEDQTNAGSDFDVDKRFIEVLQRTPDGSFVDFSSMESKLHNMSIMALAHDYQNPENYDAIKEGIDLEMADKTIERKQENSVVPPLLSPAGQAYARESNNMGEAGLSMTAVDNTAFSAMLTSKAFFELPPTFPQGHLTFTGSDLKTPYTLKITATEADKARTVKTARILKEYFGNVMNLFVDHPKLQKIHWIGYNQQSTRLATLFMLLNGDIQSKADYVAYVDTIAEFLTSSPVKNYFDKLSEIGNIGHDPLITEAERALMRTKGSPVKTLKDLVLYRLKGSMDPVVYSVIEMLNSVEKNYQDFTLLVRASDKLGMDNSALDTIQKLVIGYESALANKNPGIGVIRMPGDTPVTVNRVVSMWDTIEEYVRPGVSEYTPLHRTLSFDQLEHALKVSKLRVAADDRQKFYDSVVKTFTLNALYSGRNEHLKANPKSPSQIARELIGGAEETVLQYPEGTTELQKLTVTPKKIIIPAVGSQLATWKQIHPNNTFLQNLSIVSESAGPRIRLSEAFREEDYTGEVMEKMRQDFDKLNADQQFMLAVYSVAVYGPSYTFGTGNYFGATGKKFSKALNDAEQQEMKRWVDGFALPSLFKPDPSGKSEKGYWINKEGLLYIPTIQTSFKGKRSHVDMLKYNPITNSPTVRIALEQKIRAGATAEAKKPKSSKKDLASAMEALKGKKASAKAVARPEFDKLPGYGEGPKEITGTYAGVGSRSVVPEIIPLMTKIASALEKADWTLNTGDAAGSDAAFQAGAKIRNVFTAKDADTRTRKIAKEIHPAPEKLSQFALDLQARNTFQVFGRDLKTPVDFMIVWTPDGAENAEETTVKSGGTGQAIRLASLKGIPVINLQRAGWRDRLESIVGDDIWSKMLEAEPSLDTQATDTPPEATHSAVSIQSYMTSKQFNNTAYAMAWHDAEGPNDKLRAEAARYKIKDKRVRLGRFMRFVTDPRNSVDQKRRLAQRLYDTYYTEKYGSSFVVIRNIVNAMPEEGPKGLTQMLLPLEGLTEPMIQRQFDREMGIEGEREITYSTVALMAFNANLVSIAPSSGAHLQQTQLDYSRKMQAALTDTQAFVWRLRDGLRTVAKRMKEDIDDVDSYLGARMDGSTHIFNKVVTRLDAKGQPVTIQVPMRLASGEILKGRLAKAVMHDVVYVEQNGNEIKGGKAVKDFEARLKTNPEAWALYVELLRQARRHTERQRKRANDFLEGNTDQFIGRVKRYLGHVYKKSDGTKDTAQPPDPHKIRIAVLNQLLGKAEKDLNGHDIPRATTPEQDKLIADEVARRIHAAVVRYDHMLEEGHVSPRKVVAAAQNERQFQSYKHAAELGGLTPATMKATTNIVQWETSVSTVARNKAYLTTAALSKDINGMPALVMYKRGADLTNIQDAPLSTANTVKVLKQLVEFANEHMPIDMKKVVFSRTENPWTQIDKIVAHLETTPEGRNGSVLQNLGYVHRAMPGFGVSGVWVQEGASASLIEHVVGQGVSGMKDGRAKSILSGVLKFNFFSKIIQIGMSAFHHFALVESLVAGFGTNPKSIIKNVKGLWAVHKNLKEGKDLQKWIHKGLQASVQSPDVPSGPLDDLILDMISKTPSAAGKATLRGLLRMKQTWDHILWHQLQPVFKVQLAEHVLEDALASDKYIGISQDQLMEDVAAYVNDAFGGQEWGQYVWATPMARDLMQMSLFAPDWTISALNVAGVPQMLENLTGMQISAPRHSTLAMDQKLQNYWPAFAAVVMVGVPAAVQMAIHAAFADDDPEHKWLPWLNGEGREFYIDITPIARKLGKKYGVTRSRRVYLRWGKQAWEILGWFTDFRRTLFGKSSNTVKVFMEQVFGINGAGWDMPWKRHDVVGLLSVKGSFLDSRTGKLLEKFTPMSVLTAVQGRPTSFFAPTRLGVSATEAEDKLTVLLYSYADKEVQNKLFTSSEARHAMHGISQDILNAARINGYNPDVVFTRAMSEARRLYYHKGFDIVAQNANNPNEGELLEVIMSLRKLGATAKTFLGSMKDQSEGANMELSLDNRRMVYRLFRESKTPDYKEE